MGPTLSPCSPTSLQSPPPTMGDTSVPFYPEGHVLCVVWGLHRGPRQGSSGASQDLAGGRITFSFLTRHCLCPNHACRATSARGHPILITLKRAVWVGRPWTALCALEASLTGDPVMGRGLLSSWRPRLWLLLWSQSISRLVALFPSASFSLRYSSLRPDHCFTHSIQVGPVP